MSKNIYKIFFCFLFVLFFGKPVFAEDLTFTQFPTSPKEGEEVKLTLESDKYNLSRAKVTWTVDGVERDSGIGRKTHTLTVTGDRPVQIVVVKVEEEGLYDAQAQTIIQLSSDFILYEGADSYVPAFYKGRALPGKEGKVRVGEFSFKDGEISDFKNTGNTNYIWKINGNENPEMSGLNKILNTINTKVTDNSLTLQILKINDRGTETATAKISLQTPEVILKRTDEKKLLRTSLKDTEIGKSLNITVEPYFFSVPNKEDNLLKYVWKINNQETSLSTPWSVVFSGNQKESVKINLDIFHNQKLTQENSRGFTFRVE